MRYWDTSSLLKLYVSEADSSFFLQLLKDVTEPVITSEITKTEMLCALYAKARRIDAGTKRANVIFQRFLTDIETGHIVLAPYGTDVFAEVPKLVELAYSQPQPVMLRSLDAIQLASALVSKAKALVATDSRLRDAATLVDLPLVPA